MNDYHKPPSGSERQAPGLRGLAKRLVDDGLMTPAAA